MDALRLIFSYRRILLAGCGFFLFVLGIFSLVHNSGSTAVSKDYQAQAINGIGSTTPAQGLAKKPSPSPATTPKPDVPVPDIASAVPMLVVPMTPVDTAAYDAKILKLANLPPPKIVSGTSATSTIVKKAGPWPVKSAPYPGSGALLPFNRIVAYYGNLYSKYMGVLGKYPAPQMLEKLADAAAEWSAADPSTPVIPALDYIAVVAQASAGTDGKYRARMPASEVNKVIGLAGEAHGIVILDVQVGLSSVQAEIPLLAPYLKLPQVHLALDPEFAMHNGKKPGGTVGTMSAADINFAAEFLAKIVKENNLPPKILIVHRFTQDMLTGYKKIAPLPEVQIVEDMDGFGNPAKKIGTYTWIVAAEPIQFTGFKLFYKNDVAAGHMMTPAEVLKLSPQPSFIQYQ